MANNFLNFSLVRKKKGRRGGDHGRFLRKKKDKGDRVRFFVRLCSDALLEVLGWGNRRQLTALEELGKRFHWLIDRHFEGAPFFLCDLYIFARMHVRYIFGVVKTRYNSTLLPHRESLRIIELYECHLIPNHFLTTNTYVVWFYAVVPLPRSSALQNLAWKQKYGSCSCATIIVAISAIIFEISPTGLNCTCALHLYNQRLRFTHADNPRQFGIQI